MSKPTDFSCFWCEASFPKPRLRSNHEKSVHRGDRLTKDELRRRSAERHRLNPDGRIKWQRKFHAEHPTYDRDRQRARRADPERREQLRSYQRKATESGAGAARKAVQTAVASGRLRRGPCAECGAERVEGHHFAGYRGENRLRVMWLCKAHHELAHHRPRTVTTGTAMEIGL